MTMRPPYTIAVACFSLLLTGCIVRYTDFPQPSLDRMPAPKQESVIYYHADPEAYYAKAAGVPSTILGFVSLPFPIPVVIPIDLPRVSQGRYRELSRAFAESHVVAQAIPVTSPPDKGVYCIVDVKHRPPSEYAAIFTVMSFFFVGFIPSYSGTAMDVVRFDLYIDKELQKIYRYQVRQDRWMWVGLLPFFWVNFFTAGTDEAFRAVVNQFFLDATRDGYL